MAAENPNTNFVHTFSLWSHSFLMNKSTASCLESQKTVNSNIIIVKVSEKCFVQTKSYSNRRYLPALQESFSSNQGSLKQFLFEIFRWKVGLQKKSNTQWLQMSRSKPNQKLDWIRNPICLWKLALMAQTNRIFQRMKWRVVSVLVSSQKDIFFAESSTYCLFWMNNSVTGREVVRISGFYQFWLPSLPPTSLAADR